MTDTPSRLFGLVLVLVGIWVLTYWLYDPRGPRVTVDASATASATTVAPPAPPPVPAAAPVRTDLEPLPKVDSDAPPRPAPPEPTRVQKLLPPEFREYVVRQGDVSFEAIAARKEVYGDRTKWQAVSRANPFVTPDRLKAGVTKLRIAVDPENIQGKLVWVDEPGAGSPGGAAAAEPVKPTPPESDITYTIAEDDTLWSISKRMYGQGSQWRRIYEANKEVIKDPDRPPKGATIRIPPPEIGHAGN